MNIALFPYAYREIYVETLKLNDDVVELLYDYVQPITVQNKSIIHAY